MLLGVNGEINQIDSGSTFASHSSSLEVPLVHMGWHICWSQFIKSLWKYMPWDWNMVMNTWSIFGTSIFAITLLILTLIERVFVMFIRLEHGIGFSVTLIIDSLIEGFSYFIEGSTFISDSWFTL